MLASMSLSSLGLTMARADEKSDRRSRQYKIGAGVLGGAALYYGLKKKNPVGTIITGAGAYYAYKKSKIESDKSRRDRYGYNNPIPGGTGVYPDENGVYQGDNGYPAGSPRDGYDNGGGYDSYPRDVESQDYGTVGEDNGSYPVSTPDESVADGGDYAQNGESYPNYGLNGLRARRSQSKRGADTGARAPHTRRSSR